MIGWLAVALVAALGRRPTTTVLVDRTPDSTAVDVARLLLVAVSAGLPLGTALERIGRDLAGPLRSEVDMVVRNSRRVGLHPALVECGLGSLGPVLARAHSTGAPLQRTLVAHLEALNAARISAALERARTAPVKLMVPLVLLLLPGFVALVVGPGLVDQAIDLGTVVP